MDTSKSQGDLERPCPRITFKAIKMAEFLLQEHGGIIALSDFSLCNVAAQIAIFIHAASHAENIKIIIHDRIFLKACRPFEPAQFSFSSVKVGHGLQRQEGGMM